MFSLMFDQAFSTTRVMVIMRGLDPEESLRLATVAWDAGVTMVEIPIQSPSAVAALRTVAEAAAARGLFVGAGTVITTDQVLVARDAGAAYTVSPGTDEAIIEASLAAGLPTLPGVATASDIQRCVRLGLRWLKAFPASVLTPAWFTAMRGPFPEVRFVATGGVTVDSAPEYWAAGARAVALGSALSDPSTLDALGKLAA